MDIHNLKNKIKEGISLFSMKDSTRAEMEGYLKSSVSVLPDVSEIKDSSNSCSNVESDLKVHLNNMAESARRLSDSDKIKLGTAYLSKMMWGQLREAGIIGYACTSITSGGFLAELSVSIGTTKKDNETKAEYCKRKENIVLSMPFGTSKGIFTDNIHVINTPDNTESLTKYIEEACGISINRERVKIIVKGGLIQKISFYYSYNALADKDTIEQQDKECVHQELNIMAFAENSKNKLIKLLDAIDVIECGMDDLYDTVVSIICFSFFDMFEALGMKNEWTKSFEDNFLSCRDANAEKRKSAMEAGRSIKPDEVKEIYRKLSNAADVYFAENFRMALSDCKYSNGVMSAELHFDPLCAAMTSHVRDAVIDPLILHEGKSLYDSFIPMKNAEKIINLMSEKIYNIKLDISERYNGTKNYFVVDRIHGIFEENFISSILD